LKHHICCSELAALWLVAETALAVAPAACGGDVLMRGGRLVDRVLPGLACPPPSNFLFPSQVGWHRRISRRILALFSCSRD
jgi:hypothetical protein